MKSIFPPLHSGEGLWRAFLLSLLIHFTLFAYPVTQGDDTHDFAVERLRVYLSPVSEFSASRPQKLPTGSSQITSPDPAQTSSENSLDKWEKNKKPDSEEPLTTTQGEPNRYFSNRLLDQPTVPASGPDPDTYLKGKTDLPLFPVRLRLYVDSLGSVRKIELLSPEYLPGEKLDPIREMLMATRFIPGQIRKTRVPSYLDIEIDVSDYAKEHSR